MKGTVPPAILGLAVLGGLVALGVFAWAAYDRGDAAPVGAVAFAAGLVLGLGGAALGRSKLAAVGATTAALSLLLVSTGRPGGVDGAGLVVVASTLIALETGSMMLRSRRAAETTSREASHGSTSALFRRLLLLGALLISIVWLPATLAPLLPPHVARSIEIEAPLAIAVAGWGLMLVLVVVGTVRRIRGSSPDGPV